MERGNIMTTLVNFKKTDFEKHESKILELALTEKTYELMELADQGDKVAQEYVLTGYQLGIYGFKENFNKIIHFAKKGWKTAIVILLNLHAFGMDGKSPNRRKYLNLVNKFMHLTEVCDHYCRMLLRGSTAIPKNHETLRILSNDKRLIGERAKLVLKLCRLYK